MAPGGGMVGGPRHYDGPTLGQIGAWRCPSCGVDNTTPFEDGCPDCGAGSAKPRHVGVPPSRPADADRTQGQREATTLPVDMAFGTWMAPHRGEFSPHIEQVLFDAWTAAIRWYQSTLQERVMTTPIVDQITIPKVLLLRVVSTLEATTDLPDDQQSPDLLTLIAEVKELLES